MEALYDFDELDEYIDEHAADFASYEARSTPYPGPNPNPIQAGAEQH